MRQSPVLQILILATITLFIASCTGKQDQENICGYDDVFTVLSKLAGGIPFTHEDSVFYEQYKSEIEKRNREFIRENPPQDTLGLIPLYELGENTYNKFQGGLYPGGSNEIPVEHLQKGKQIAAEIQPLDPHGRPVKEPRDGKVVLMAIGMSNAKEEFHKLKKKTENDTNINDQLVMVNSSFGGQTLELLACDEAPGWWKIEEILCKQKVTAYQVQAIWLKCATRNPSGGFPGEAEKLKNYIIEILPILKSKYPNLKICYLSSRSYAGYAQSILSPEPYAYETGFGVKWAIEEQINGNLQMNYDEEKGKVLAPWICWGPYFWADGLNVGANAMYYEAKDFEGDGIHLTRVGANKVAALLQFFFMQHPTTINWFLDENNSLHNHGALNANQPQ